MNAFGKDYLPLSEQEEENLQKLTKEPTRRLTGGQEVRTLPKTAIQAIIERVISPREWLRLHNSIQEDDESGGVDTARKPNRTG